nr:diguanylate cyclase [Aliikangiella sp. G2MR2-5]
MLGLVLKYSHKVIRLIEQKEKKLLISENRFKSLFYSDIVAVFEWHLDGRIFDANNAFLDMIGYEREELVNSRISWRELTPDAGEERDRQAIKEIQEKGFCMPFEKQYIHKSGRTVSILLGAALLGGETQKGIAFAIDLTDKKKAEENVRLLASVFNSTSNAVIITDKDFKVVSVNQTYQQQTGYSEEQIVDQLVPFLSSSVISDRKREVILNQLNLNSHYQHDISYLGVAGKEMASMLTINEINDDNGVVTHYAFILTDISELKEMEEKLKKLAHYDLLTGLANRKLFNDRVKKALQRAKRNKSTLALLFLDLDGFKPVNDQYGHDMGDKLLTQVARRLKESVRENDSVARFGGDEFVILLEGLDYAQAAGNVARKLIENLNRPFFVDNICLKLGCSIGISLYPDDSDELEALIRFGDIAMYAAKSSGRNRYYYFNPKLDSFGDNGSSSEISDPPSSS